MDIAAHRKGLADHAATKKHLRNLEREKLIASTPKMTQFTKKRIDDKRKRAELKIAAFIAEHCSMRTVDHLGEVIPKLDPSSETLTQLKLHRTKCTGLILNVISPCLLQDLIADICDSHYSLIIDETTTVDTKKVMCLMIRYFSINRRKVHTAFYRLIEIESESAEHMTNCLQRQLEVDNLKAQNLIGIGIDGANAMAGEHNSVSSKLTELIPHLVTVKCLSNSLHLSAEHACDVLPKNLDFLVKESHSWFSRSTKRNMEYTQLHKTIADSNPKKIVKLSGTRWLARLDAIETILDQWDSLELHFNTSRLSERGDAGFKAETLYEMYRCVENKLNLLFLRNSLKGVISLNKLFQSESAEPLKLLQDLNNLLYSTLQKIVVPQPLEKAYRQNLCKFAFKGYLMNVDCIDFWYYFNQLSMKCNPENLVIIKQRCRDFLVKLSEELQKRVSANVKIHEKICIFTPEIASSQIKEDITEIASFFEKVSLDVEKSVTEWKVLHRLELEDVSTSDEYWAKVNENKDAGGVQRFKHVAKLSLSVLSLPSSNAAVERSFSILNIIKDKIRNRMSIVTADAVLRVRYLLTDKCVNFEPTQKMFEMFTSEQVYTSEFVEDILDAVVDAA